LLEFLQQSLAGCREETARCRSCSFGLKSANDIRYKLKCSKVSIKQGFRAPYRRRQTTCCGKYSASRSTAQSAR